jgi:hypothetical protein
LAKRKKIFCVLIFALLGGYILRFYSAAAVLRLPVRVTIPYLLIFVLTTVFCLEFSGVKTTRKKLEAGNLISVLFIIIFF